MTGQTGNSRREGTRGFRRAAALVSKDIRTAGEARGFAVSRVLTHWDEIAGPDLAGRTRPVNITYGRSGLGATLTLLTTGAEAPMVEMQKEALRERINACYGYAAISRIRITQTAPTGFSEGQAEFAHAPKPAKTRMPSKADQARAAEETADVTDPGLKRALALLGANIHSRDNS
ncbi:DUF721 domain-containing protein [Ovoidimarina sediminis]|uniref:DUF721 domain-containing protein n=1 Tax=Ovoidimarina sediminis TaxID=3079856 RepID=UPI002910D27C|nr:DciA family protein [Rhodophyticola sp. MJ-SS7]MDU8942445.1 DciA family protein [Rhodophyticola sp. MJ-SS7]